MGNLSSHGMGVRYMEEGMQAYKREEIPLAIQLHWQAKQCFDKHKSISSIKAAQCMDRLSEFYYRLGQLSKALSCCQEALEIKQQELLVVQVQQQSRQRQQQHCTRQQQQQHKRRGATGSCPRTCHLARTLSNIACIFCQCGEWEKARYLLQGVLELRQQSCTTTTNTNNNNRNNNRNNNNNHHHDLDDDNNNEESLEVAKTCTNLAIVLQKLGHMDQALRLHQKAQRIKELKAPQSATLARTYINLAITKRDATYFAKAKGIIMVVPTKSKSKQQPKQEQPKQTKPKQQPQPQHTTTTTTTTNHYNKPQHSNINITPSIEDDKYDDETEHHHNHHQHHNHQQQQQHHHYNHGEFYMQPNPSHHHHLSLSSSSSSSRRPIWNHSYLSFFSSSNKSSSSLSAVAATPLSSSSSSSLSSSKSLSSNKLSSLSSNYSYSTNDAAEKTALQALLDMNIGTALVWKGNISKAIQYYQKAIERELVIAPKSLNLAQMCHLLSLVYLQDGRVYEAQVCSTKANTIWNYFHTQEKPLILQSILIQAATREQ